MADESRRPGRFQIGDLVLDAGTHTVTRDGEEIPLTRLSFALLAALARGAPKLMTRDELLNSVWGDVVVSNEALKQRIKMLRQAIGDASDTPRYVASVRGLGYRLIAPVEILPEEGSVDADRAQKTTPLTMGYGFVGMLRRRNVAIPGLIALLIVASVSFYHLIHARDDPRTTNEPSASITEIPRRSVAVLPFENISGDEANEPFTIGIHDDLLTYLSKIRSIKTISRTSVLPYRDTRKSLTEIAGELGVATIMEGVVQRAEDRVRINVQLIDAATNVNLWAESYDRQLTTSNIFAIQSEIAAAIADALRTSLTPAERDRIKSVPTQNMAALEAYFLGRQLFYQRGAALDGAIAALRSAVDRDPVFAEAWTYLAAAAWATWGYDTAISDENALALAQVASRRALELDPDIGLALAVRANLAEERRELVEALDLHHRAIDADPNDSTIQMWFGQFTFFYGYLSQALVNLERAYELDPLVGINNGALGIAYLASGQEALAQPRLAKAAELGWNHHVPTNFNHLIHSGTFESAIAYRELFYVESTDPNVLRGRHLLGEAVRHRDSAAVDALEPYIDAVSLPGGWGQSLFLVFDLRDQFFDSFSKLVAADPHWPYAMRPVWLPGNRTYIEDPRFLELMHVAGAAALWEQRGYPDGCIRLGDSAGDRLDCVERYR